ncbi:matrixin family metalloprotease [Candidatus Micrarchaeota archaeon]|nr:matrixin family metalloprotease [Candidatus Micrarchaeota archaeon]
MNQNQVFAFLLGAVVVIAVSLLLSPYIEETNQVITSISNQTSLGQNTNNCEQIFTYYNTNFQELNNTNQALSINCSAVPSLQYVSCVSFLSAQIKQAQNSTRRVIHFLEQNEEQLLQCGLPVVPEVSKLYEYLLSLHQSEASIPKIRTNSVINIYAEPLPEWTDPGYETVIQTGFNYWRNATNTVFQRVDDSTQADVLAQWVKDFGSHTLGHVVREDFVQLGLGDSRCGGEWKPYSRETIERVTIHELGHVVGLPHSEEENDVMYPTLSTKYELDVDETQLLAPLFAGFYSLCAANSSTYSFNLSSTNSRFDVYIVPSVEEFERFSRGGSPQFFQECGNALKTQEFHTQCRVTPGSGVIIANPYEESSATVTIKARQE